jgi:nucleoside-diphosphate-sugar epimerase
MASTLGRIAIFGAAGTIGRICGRELANRGLAYTAVGRDRERLLQAHPNGSAIVTADLAEESQAREACRHADTVVYAVGVDYSRFALHPKLMRITCEAAAAEGVSRLIVVSSVYSYGAPQSERVSETHPRQPHTRKGRFRMEQEDIALQADSGDGTGRGLRTLVFHLPDFYGPHARLSFAHVLFEAALAGKTANWIGPLDLPHEFIYAPDAAAPILDLAACSDVWGQRWNLGGAGVISGRRFLEAIYTAAGATKPKYRTAGSLVLGAMALFSPFMREVKEMYYLWDKPLILDDSKLRQRLGGVSKTSYEEGIRRTVEWMRAEHYPR